MQENYLVIEISEKQTDNPEIQPNCFPTGNFWFIPKENFVEPYISNIILITQENIELIKNRKEIGE